MKTCRICKTEKPITDFYTHKNTKDRLRNECKNCYNTKSLDYYFCNKDSLSDKRKSYHYKRNYGLSLDEINSMREAQNSSCAICEETTNLVVDHNHTSGIVRALLCSRCNQGLGLFRENPIHLAQAIKYLKEYQT